MITRLRDLRVVVFAALLLFPMMACAVVPDIPSSVTATNASSGGVPAVKVDWSENSGIANSYPIYRSLDGSVFTHIATQTNNTLRTWTDPNVSFGQTYYYLVRSANQDGFSQVSNIAQINLVNSSTSPPTAPSSVVASSVSNPGQPAIQVSWVDNATNVASYVMYRSTDGTQFQNVATVQDESLRSWVDNNVAFGNTYYYRVRGSNPYGFSPFSNTSQINLTSGTSTAPPAPVSVTATASSAGGVPTIQISWVDNSGLADRYIVWRGTSATSFPAYWFVNDPSVKTFTDQSSTLQFGQTYYYRVTGANALGWSPHSSVVNATPGAPATPTAPTIELSLNQNVPDGVLSNGRWERGFRNGGTLNFSPNLSVVRGDFHGTDSIAMQVLSHNSTEYIDYVLQTGEKGPTWRAEDHEYFSFWYYTGNLNGRMTIRLNEGERRWGSSGGRTWGAEFEVSPGGWTRVVLPLGAFVQLNLPDTRNNDMRHGIQFPITLDDSLGVHFVSTIAIGHENNQLQNEGTIKFAEFKVGQFHKGIVGSPADTGELKIMRTGAPASAALPQNFEMGAKPDDQYTILLEFGGQNSANSLFADYTITDCFHRDIKTGVANLTWTGTKWQAQVPLNAAESKQLFYSEYFSAHATVYNTAHDTRDIPPNGFAWPELKLRYQERDNHVVTALAATYHQTEFGNLRLVDQIDCAANADTLPQPYKVGGWRSSWVGSRAYSYWQQGVDVKSFAGDSFREAANNESFGYRVGRGTLTPGAAYLLRVKYAEDKSRYAVMDVQNGLNFQSIGFRTGLPGNPNKNGFDYPLNGGYDWYDTIVVLDDVTYGYGGSRSADSDRGFWVFFHDIGRCFGGLYDGGPAIAEIRLYELGSGTANYPAINYPAGAPRRILMADWERQPEQVPTDISHWARLVGLNAISPVIQKWTQYGFWHNSLGYGPASFFSVTPEGGQEDLNAYSYWLAVTKARGIGFIPRIEYGGSPTLTSAAHVRDTNGNIKTNIGRYASTGANLLHQATRDEFETIIDELIGTEIADNPQLMGLLWRHRSDRVQISWGAADVQMFCQDRGLTFPSGNASTWAFQNHRTAYETWWQEKRRDFMVDMKNYLRTYRPDLALMYYNWDEDTWADFGPGDHQKGLLHKSGLTPTDWHNMYNVNNAPAFWAQSAPAILTPAGWVNELQNLPARHDRIFPAMYNNAAAAGVYVFAPVHRQFLADNSAYISNFQTGSGIAISNIFDYEERPRLNVQGDIFEASSMEPAGRFGLAHEIYSMFHGDPVVMTSTTYTCGRGSASLMREFAKAYLALPNQPGTLVTNGSPNSNVRVRTYTVNGVKYIGVVYKGLTDAQFTVTVSSGGAISVINAATGAAVTSTASGGNLTWTVNSGPMKLYAFRLN